MLRRLFTSILAPFVAAALALSGSAVHAEDAAPAPFALHELAPGVYAAIDIDGRAGANAGFVIGRDAVAVIDSFYRPDATRALLAEIRRRTALPVRFVVNTHHHIDHVGGNAVLAEAGALVIGHRQLPEWQHDENLRLLGARAGERERAQLAALPAPALLVRDALELDLGGRRVAVRHWLGHTGGDLVVSVDVDGQRIAFLGDLFWCAAIPNLTDATVADWVPTLAVLESTAVRFVPGHGPLGGAAELRAFRDYLATGLQLAGAVADDMAARGSTEAEAQAALLERLRERFGERAYFKGLAPGNARDLLAERQGRKRVPAASPAPR